MAKAHPGFQAVQKGIEKEGYSKESAGAILASRTRKASPAAKKANPRLNRVNGSVHSNKGMNMNKGMSYVS